MLGWNRNHSDGGTEDSDCHAANSDSERKCGTSRRGLVKVQTDWQKFKNKTTNWIRCQAPDAGKSDKVGQNRGFIHIPEKDDIVMLGFEYGSPDRPFVAGSVFTSQTGKGGDTNKKIKSLTTTNRYKIECKQFDNNYLEILSFLFRTSYQVRINNPPNIRTSIFF